VEAIVTDISEAEREKRAHEIVCFLRWCRIDKEGLEGWDPETETDLQVQERLQEGFENHPEWWKQFYGAMARMREEFWSAKIACEALL
jgi:hypothetical protein